MSYYGSYYTTNYTEPQELLYQDTINGSFILLEPQTIIMPPVSVKNVGARTIMPGTGKLYVYIACLPSYVSVYVNVNGISVPLKAGSNEIPMPGNVEIGPITIISNNGEEVSVSLWAFLAG